MKIWPEGGFIDWNDVCLCECWKCVMSEMTPCVGPCLRWWSVVCPKCCALTERCVWNALEAFAIVINWLLTGLYAMLHACECDWQNPKLPQLAAECCTVCCACAAECCLLLMWHACCWSTEEREYEPCCFNSL